MAERTGISWTDYTFNVAWGCAKVSPGCAHCYAEDLAARYGGDVWGAGAPRKVLSPGYWTEPLKWNRKAEREGQRRRVFCSSMADVFEQHPTIDAERSKLWPLIQATPMLDWLLLTKRADRIEANLPAAWGAGWPNVWLGASIESAPYAWRADCLRRIPAAVRFVSYEPALEGLAGALDLSGIDWLIYGGESGSKFRQDDPAWARDMLRACRAARVTFFYKQAAGRMAGTRPELDGVRIQEWPAPRRASVAPAPAQLGLFGTAP